MKTLVVVSSLRRPSQLERLRQISPPDLIVSLSSSTTSRLREAGIDHRHAWFQATVPPTDWADLNHRVHSGLRGLAPTGPVGTELSRAWESHLTQSLARSWVLGLRLYELVHLEQATNLAAFAGQDPVVAEVAAFVGLKFEAIEA